MLKHLVISLLFFLLTAKGIAWGFYAHKEINYHAVFMLPPAMMTFYKPNIEYLKEHAVDPDKRRYVVDGEAPRHYIDLDFYGQYPFNELPRKYADAVEQYTEATLQSKGIVPWYIQTMLQRLTYAMQQKNYSAILKLSADIGHYIADAHVPLHAHSNYNGQLTNQHGIHALWESRIPELLAKKEFSYFMGKAQYIEDPLDFMWKRVLESALAADTVLNNERSLSLTEPYKFSYEYRNGKIIRQYASAFTIAFHQSMNGMVERRMRQSISAIACFWYTAWVNAGQPDLKAEKVVWREEELAELRQLDAAWQTGTSILRSCDN